MSFEAVLTSLPGGLTKSQVVEAFTQVISGEVSDVQVAAFLYGLRVRGETADEVIGIAEALAGAAPALTIAGPLLDIVGTGGDRTGAISISTPASVLAATITPGVTVVKHGNRGATTKTGSADVIEAWGIPLDLTPRQVEAVAAEAGITFCFAPRFHAAMKHTAPARRALEVPTVMNMLGPLLNPAAPQHQLVGVADPARVGLMTQALRARGTTALVARGRDGLDKITVTGVTDVTLVVDQTITSFEIAPEDVGLARRSLVELGGSTPAENARRLVGALDGSEHGAVLDAVLVNAAAASALAEGARDDLLDAIRAKIDQGRAAIADGAARATLRAWVAAADRHTLAP